MTRQKLFTKKELMERVDLVSIEKIIHHDYSKEYGLHTLVTKTKHGIFSEYCFYNEVKVDACGCEYIPCRMYSFGIPNSIETKLFLK